jgi:plasmid stabilization system protein ParE
MTYSLSFLPEVEEDVISAYAWYEEKARGLGEEFLRIFYASANNLSRNPLLYQKVHGDFRRLLLRRFPYAIYFMIKENEIIVLGLFHCARDPQTIQLTLSNRDT